MICMEVDMNDAELEMIAREIKTIHPNSEIVLFQDPLLAWNGEMK